MTVDVDLSNGTCFYSENSPVQGDMIPCGNTALGHWPCCYAGDTCLGFDDANACYDATTGNTYLGGCTDIGFNSRACPWKSPLFSTQEWVPIQQCVVGTGKNDTEWGGCKIPDGSTELVKLPHASCDPYCSSTHIYLGTSAIPGFASLPSSISSDITWTNGFNPVAAYAGATSAPGSSHTTTTASTTHSTTGTAATSSQSITSAGPLPTSSDSSTGASQDTGLSTGAKAGIGVGTVAAVFLIIGVVFLGLLVRRRRKKATEESYVVPPEQSQYTGPEGGQLSPKPWPGASPSPYGGGAGEYTGFKSELAADESVQAKTFRSELPADEPALSVPSPNVSATSPQSTHASHNQQSDRFSTISDVSTVQGGHTSYISPQNTGEVTQHGTHSGHVAMDSISELQG